MQYIKSQVIFILFSFILVGCFEKLSYSYLMQHPKVLSQKIADCQSTDEKTKAEIKECQIVLYAAANMTTLISDQQEAPETFGQRIMNLELNYVQIKEQFDAATQKVNALQEKNSATTVELQAAKQALDKIKRSYLDKREELKVLLAVVGINSPE